MIIEVDITTLEVRVDGAIVGTTTSEKMHKARDYARKYLARGPKQKSTYYTVLDGKMASMHEVTDEVAERIKDYLLRN